LSTRPDVRQLLTGALPLERVGPALRRAALLYRVAHGASYFDDLVAVHRSLGLAADWGNTRVLAHLTPVKEKEDSLILKR